MMHVRERPEQKAREGLDMTSRVGLAAYGLLHLLVAWVAAQLAFGFGVRDTSGQGAMRQLAADPVGRVLVWVIAFAMAGFTLQRLVEGWMGDRGEEGVDLWKHRARAWGKAVVYAAISVSAFGIASHSGGGGSNRERSLSARVMDHTGGTIAVVAVGAGILALGLWQCYHGLTRDFRDELSADGKDGETGKVYLALGQIGYTAKGLVITLVGVLVGYAGVTHEPRKSGGLDEALQTVRDQPFGPVLLCAVAAGIAAYGLFCFAKARHLSP